jgi:DNA-binding CsgD family transcriptional regulator
MSAGYVPLRRARYALRLVREVREIGVGTEDARRHLLAGVAHEVGAAIGGIVSDSSFDLGLKAGLRAATLYGFDSQLLPVFEAHHIHGSEINPVHRRIMLELRESPHSNLITFAEDRVLMRRAWEAEPWVVDYVRPNRLDHFVGSARLVGPSTGEGIGLMRAQSDAPFSEEDCSLLDLIIEECGPLFGNDTSPAPVAGPKLAPRVRETLECLLTGATDKEIASKLGMSPHTVRDYLKTLYRVYGVTTRGALIALVLRERAANGREI